jgi:methionyl-tRNA formyltransferase
VSKIRKIAFLGSKAIGAFCLSELINRQDELKAKVVAVLTKANKLDFSETVLSIAKENEIPILSSLDDLKEIDDLDIIISVQHHEILRSEHIELASQIAVNLHMAPLPEYRGCNQFTFAILDEAKTFGTSLHRLEPGIDSGSILFEKRFPVPEKCTVKELYEKTVEASKKLFSEKIEDLIKGNYSPVSQSDLEEERGSSYHYRHEIDEVKKIDLNWPKEKIEKHIRATHMPPFTPPYAIKDGQKVELTLDKLDKIK